MSFGSNLQYLRKLSNGMTQENLAEKLNVSRQTISKWELDQAYPEINKLVELCDLFSCSMDQLVRENINPSNEAYSNIRVETVTGFNYTPYVVVSAEPEEDAQNHVMKWAMQEGITQPDIIGRDFPYVSQEQINVYHMHGYMAACVLPPDHVVKSQNMPVVWQEEKKYAIITVKDPFEAAFLLIPNAYKALYFYMEVNGLKSKESKDILDCYERVYEKDDCTYMDIYIRIDE